MDPGGAVSPFGARSGTERGAREIGRKVALAAGFLTALSTLASGCSFGPKAIEQTHGRYGAAVQRVEEEEEFLKNVVRLRYVEAPRNLDVAAIAAQYELSVGAEARPFFSSEATGNLFQSFTAILAICICQRGEPAECQPRPAR